MTRLWKVLLIPGALNKSIQLIIFKILLNQLETLELADSNISQLI